MPSPAGPIQGDPPLDHHYVINTTSATALTTLRGSSRRRRLYGKNLPSISQGGFASHPFSHRTPINRGGRQTKKKNTRWGNEKKKVPVPDGDSMFTPPKAGTCLPARRQLWPTHVSHSVVSLTPLEPENCFVDKNTWI